MPLLVVIAVVALVALIIVLWPVPVVALAAWALYRLIRYIRKIRYFSSEAFLSHKAELAAIVAEHNEIAGYIAEMRGSESFAIGASATGSHSRLASFENTSLHNYRRDRNLAQYENRNVHNCSLQVVRNAAAEPLKYLVKYFDISVDEAGLNAVQVLGDNISRLEEAVSNLLEREASIADSFNPPAFILKHYRTEFMKQVGIELSPIKVPYPVYVFEYVSAGGNSSQRTTVKLGTPVIDELSEMLVQKIRFKKSAAGQRSLMTAKLRSLIKERDDYTCLYCSISVVAEPHLLLEVDHVVPVSKGGLSTEDNLQTLCWRCNRAKSNKILQA